MDISDGGAQRAGRPTRRDVLIAVGAATLAIGGLLVLPLLEQVEPSVVESAPDPGTTAWWAGLIVLVVQSIALVWRRHHVVAVTAAVAVAVPIGAACGMAATLGQTSIAILVAVYTLAMARPAQQAWVLLTGVFVAITAGHLLAGLDDDLPTGQSLGEALLQGAALVAVPVIAAFVVATRIESRSARKDQARARESEHAALVQRAIARERATMARELHDIATHHLTGIAIMSAAVSTQIDTDPAAAKRSVGDLRQQSTAVLRDLRSLVALLRDDDASTDASRTDGAPAGIRVESLAGITDLVKAVADSGREVGLTVVEAASGQPLGHDIGPLAQLAAYRMVQESLSNAGRHAPGARCEAEIDDRAPDALVVTVHNSPAERIDGASDRGGFGLVGMQERADLTGSALTYGPLADGGWSVRLRTPRTPPVEDA